ncbi:hypothetical protein ACFQ3S_04990 [Mucilaginibacter terrae]|uniref:hypothetical protein n=1 Tax=Mucilaginibacter terrae TaxID=1955052 RepID=UPI00362BF208
MKKLLILKLLIFAFVVCNAQKQTTLPIIKRTIIDFLKWHKAGSEFENGRAYFVPRYDEKDTTKTYFDSDSLELYYNRFRKSNFVSETYINQLKEYFSYYGKFIGPKRSPGEIVKIEGLDQDIVLGTFEPEVILDNLSKARITKSLIVHRKALLSVNFAKEVNLVFILTKQDKTWLIDYLGPDNTSINSFFRQ